MLQHLNTNSESRDSNPWTLKPSLAHQRRGDGRFKEKSTTTQRRHAADSLCPTVLYVHFAPLINICLSTSLMTPLFISRPPRHSSTTER